MIEKLIKDYLNKITYKDIIVFASKNNINITDNEAKIIYNHLINDYHILLYNDATPIFNKLYNEVSIETYNKCKILYNEYMNKYKSYL